MPERTNKHHRDGDTTSARFTLDEARTLIARAERNAWHHGYVLALYGSVLRDGEGRDLDLIARPHRHPHDEDAFLADLAADLPGVITQDDTSVAFPRRYVVIQLGAGRYIDLKVTA